MAPDNDNNPKIVFPAEVQELRFVAQSGMETSR